MSAVPRSLFSASIRACVARRDLAALSRVVRAAGADALVAAWPSLSPLERLASFKMLPRRDAAAAFSGLDPDGRWLAFLGAPAESVAPLLEDAPRGARRSLRRVCAAEREAMRRAQSR